MVWYSSSDLLYGARAVGYRIMSQSMVFIGLASQLAEQSNV